MKIVLAVVILAVVRSMPAYAAPRDPDVPARRPTPAASRPPVQMPSGLYRVTDVYVADVVTRSGDLTVYSTVTRYQDTDTYARVLQSVSTGERSAYDRSSVNGRGALSDARPIAGTYYQNFVFDGAAYRPVSIVFFQDDSELARRSPPSAGAPRPSGPSLPPGPTLVPLPRVTAAPWPAPTIPPFRIGVDPIGGAAAQDLVEVARGARYDLRVNVIGARLVAWSLTSGVNDAVNAAGWHDGNDPLVGQWLRLPSPGATWALSLRVRVAVGGTVTERDGIVRVAVRSPAVVE